MKHVNKIILSTLALLGAASLSSCGGTDSLKVTVSWASGYEKCQVKPIAESNLATGLSEHDFGLLPSNTALTGNITSTPVFKETDPSLVSAKANIIAARADDYKAGGTYAKKLNAVSYVLSTDAVKDFINSKYNGKVSYAYENTAEADLSANYAYSAATDGDSNVITIGASEIPHAEILNSDAFQNGIKALGWKVTASVADWAGLNGALSKKEYDANYFQHVPYMETYNAESSVTVKLTAVCKVHYEPLACYKGTKTTQDAIFNGATIEICNDESNAERALELLKYQGIITSYKIG